MTPLTEDTCYELIHSLGRTYSQVNSFPELLQATLEVTSDIFNPDVSLIAEKDNGGLNKVASSPSEWTDNDDLLSPASLPSVIASQGIKYLIGNRGDVRGAAATESLPKSTSIAYESVLVVPFGEGTVLIVGSKDNGAYTEGDLETLRIISIFASNIGAWIKAASEPRHVEEHVSDAAASLSHDAKNFLTIIEGRLELARENPQAEHFDAIERATERLGELIEDTRTLLETGTHAADMEVVPLGEVVHEAWDVEQTKEAELVVASMESIHAERSRVCQLLENLFRNAVEHAGPEVTVWVGMLPNNQGFYVEDDGPGIDPEERESVLEFAYSNSEGNTGLGLNIVKWIAAAHGWEMSIDEGQLGGARFEFTGVEIAS